MASLSKQGMQQTGNRIGRQVLRFVAGRAVFFLLLFLAVVITGTLIWQRAVSPLLDEPVLPVDQAAATVDLSTQELQSIIDRRSQRINFTPRSFARFNRLFPGSVSASPTPSPSPSPTPTPTAG